MARGHPDYLVTAGKTGSGETKIDWDFLVNNGTLVTGIGTATGGSVILHTVPTGKVFFLVACSLATRNSTATDALCTIDVITTGGNILAIETGLTDENTEVLAVSFPIPLKISAGETLSVTSGNIDVAAVGAFAGYEVDV